MENVSPKTVDDFIQSCHRAARRGLIQCSSGNLSQRVDGKRLLITSSQSWMEKISPDDISLCLISDGSLLAGGKPSAEIGFHVGILQTRPDVNVVLHFQTPCATALACWKPKSINYFVIPEIPFHIGHIAYIPYLPPGSPELACAVTNAMLNHDMIIMGNHGQVTVASDPDHVIQNAVFFELACAIILHSGDRVAPLPKKDIDALLELRQSVKSAV